MSSKVENGVATTVAISASLVLISTLTLAKLANNYFKPLNEEQFAKS